VLLVPKLGLVRSAIVLGSIPATVSVVVAI